MSTLLPPNHELRNLISKPVRVTLNENRAVTGILIGFDTFMNLSIRNARVEVPNTEPVEVESVVLRGSSVLSFDCVNTK